MKKSTLNKFCIRVGRYISMQILIINTVTTSCSYMHESHMKKTDLDTIHDSKEKKFTEGGIKFIETTIHKGEDLLAKIYQLPEPISVCTLCERKVYRDMHFAIQDTENSTTCASCRFTKGNFTVYESENKQPLAELEKLEAIKESEEEKNEPLRVGDENREVIRNFKRKKTCEPTEEISNEKIIVIEREKQVKEEPENMIGSSRLCDVLCSIYSTIEYICNFDRRPIEQRVQGTKLTLGEALEHFMSPDIFPMLVFYNAYVASLYKNSNLSKDFITNNFTKEFITQIDNLSINMILNILIKMQEFSINQLKTSADKTLENTIFIDKICKYITGIISVHFKNKTHISMQQNICQCIQNEAVVIYNRFISPPLATIPDITKIIPQNPQAAQFFNMIRTIENLINSIHGLKKPKIKEDELKKMSEQLDAETWNQNVEKPNQMVEESPIRQPKPLQSAYNLADQLYQKIILDDFYNKESDDFTEKGRILMRNMAEFAEKITTPIYGYTDKMKCSMCQIYRSTEMLLKTTSNNNLNLCTACLCLGGEFEYKTNFYTIKNKTLYLNSYRDNEREEISEVNILRLLENDENDKTVILEKGKKPTYLEKLELYRSSNICYLAETMCSLLKRTVRAYRRPFSDRTLQVEPSELIELYLNEDLLPYYIFYLSHAACLYHESELLYEGSTSKFCEPLENFIAIAGLDSLCVPTLIIALVNNYIASKGIPKELISNKGSEISCLFSRYIAQIAKREVDEKVYNMYQPYQLTIDDLKKDVDFICKKIFNVISNENDEQFDFETFEEFEEENLLGYKKLATNDKKYSMLYEKNKSYNHFHYEENTNNVSYCKVAIIAAAINVPLYYILTYISTCL